MRVAPPPTEAGLDLQRVSRVTDEQLVECAERAQGQELDVTGEVILTSVEIVSPLVARGIAGFRSRHPDTMVRYIATGRILRLAYGQAHVAIRAGTEPAHPNEVVRPFFPLRSTFYAHARYVERYGLPTTEAELAKHFFVSHENPTRAQFFTWLESHVPTRNIVLRSANQRVLIESMLAGVGIGFLPVFQAASIEGLHPMMPPRPDWVVPLWLVTHVDLHRTSKVKAISAALSAVAEQVITTSPFS